MSITTSQREKFVNQGEMIVGIDVAKHTHVTRILFPDGSESKAFGFSNNRRGFEDFIAWISSYKGKAENGSIIVGLESTGHYWEPLAFYLEGVARWA
jgi:transposase